MTSLHTLQYGEGSGSVVFLHGLFGQGRNWNTIGKALAADHRITLVDLPNHGRSDWTDRMDYVQMADIVATEVLAPLAATGPVALVGHSMGGKVAMMAALRHPELIERLVVADMAPVSYSTAREFTGYIEAMHALDLNTLASREDADAALVEAVPSASVRAFLLQNLRRDGVVWRWQPNLEILARDAARLSDWPADEVAGLAPYDGPVLWIAGAESAYITPEFDAAMTALFPRKRLVTIKGAGHWVHSEKPEIFTEALRRFLAG
ncbi:alpha/beta fold hydrolase [Nocardioides nematodiphilus]|uniref:alpha/beta fold hydrolase n=1 Tax=Nocardioides nematodiphilus TaxID=2849669 RepID=UPI001CD9DE76|nr:alpha/beta fold hydrolase [Nocardioides nematodiphilus]MCA1982331.1 alpha/beta fold hydrolase [Nocardioides nematodiphilus]